MSVWKPSTRVSAHRVSLQSNVDSTTTTVISTGSLIIREVNVWVGVNALGTTRVELRDKDDNLIVKWHINSNGFAPTGGTSFNIPFIIDNGLTFKRITTAGIITTEVGAGIKYSESG